MNRALIIALAISLTLNVFIVGAVAGAYGARARFSPARPPAPNGNPLMRAAERLPPEVSAAYRTRMRAESVAARPLVEESREARRAAAEEFGKPSFDKAAAMAALAKARTAETAAREKLETAIVDFAGGLPVEQRRAIGAGIRQPPRPGPGGPGGPGGGRRRGGPDGPPPFERDRPMGDRDGPRRDFENAP